MRGNIGRPAEGRNTLGELNMKPETIEYIGKVLTEDRGRAAKRLEDLVRIHNDSAKHPSVMDAINDLKRAERRVEDFRDWEEDQPETEEENE